MSSPQIWVMLALFSTLFFGMLQFNNRSLVHRLDGMERHFDDRVDGLEQRLDAKIDGVEERLSTRIDALADVTDARFSEVGHRLSGLEGDMTLVKGHLIGKASA